MGKYKKVISSPIRWAGSKKRILNEMLEIFPNNKKNYIEMFLGSGIVLLNVLENNDKLRYKNYYVNDINSNIINFYILLRDNVDYLINRFSILEIEYNSGNMKEKENYFYKKRIEFNQMEPSEDKAVLFYFLMKTGYNGVYRENSYGKYNVPFGRKEKIVIDEEKIKYISKKIKKVKFFNLNYSDFIKELKKRRVIKNSFIYCDPPYLPDDDLVNQKQELYTKDSFEHLIFFENLNSIEGNTDIMVSMSASKKADSVYNKEPFIKINLCEIIRLINPKKKFLSNEIAFINFNKNYKKNDSQ